METPIPDLTSPRSSILSGSSSEDNELNNQINYCLDEFVSSHHTFSVDSMSQILLTHVLQISQGHQGYVAFVASSNVPQMKYVAEIGLKNLIRLNESWNYHDKTPNKSLYTPKNHPSWMIIHLTFKNKFCGAMGLENLTSKTHEQFKSWIRPLVPITASNIIGFYQISQETSNTQDLFLSTISHEIRTPLNGIVGINRILRESSPLTAEQKSYLTVITECTHQLLELINDILDFSKMGCDQLNLENTLFDLRSCIEEINDYMYLKIQEKKISLIFEIEPRVPHYMMGDKKRIRQILLNLVTNAIKFTDFGAVTVRVDHKKNLHGHHQIMYFEVEDTGTGIPHEQHQQIFKSFFQVKTQQPRCEGVGLGLAICKKLCELMGGNIDVKYSLPGKGTCIYFFLPYLSPPENYDWPKDKDSSMNLAAEKHVLLFDLQPERRLKILHELIRTGLKPFSCASFEECRSYLTYIKFDLAIIPPRDHQQSMPVIDEMREILEQKNIPVCWLIDEMTGVNHDQKSMYLKINSSATAEDINSQIKDFFQHSFPDITIPIEGYKHQSSFFKPPSAVLRDHTIIEPLDILVVEDNHHNMFVITEILKKLGYGRAGRGVIDTAKSGPEAIQKGVFKMYDVILMDLLIPGIDGISAGIQILNYHKSRCPKNLRATLDKYDSLLPTIIAVTAMLTNDTQIKCKQGGFKAFLSKPLNQDELEIMLNVVSHKRQQSSKALQGKNSI